MEELRNEYSYRTIEGKTRYRARFESRFVGKLTFKGGYPTDETGQAALLDMPGVERVSTARQIGRG